MGRGSSVVSEMIASAAMVAREPQDSADGQENSPEEIPDVGPTRGACEPEGSMAEAAKLNEGPRPPPFIRHQISAAR